MKRLRSTLTRLGLVGALVASILVSPATIKSASASPVATENFSTMPADLTTYGAVAIDSSYGSPTAPSLRSTGNGDYWYFSAGGRFASTGDLSVDYDIYWPSTATSRDIANFAFWVNTPGPNANGFLFRLQNNAADGGFFVLTGPTHNPITNANSVPPAALNTWYRVHLRSNGNIVEAIVTVRDTGVVFSDTSVDVSPYLDAYHSTSGTIGQAADAAGDTHGHFIDNIVSSSPSQSMNNTTFAASSASGASRYNWGFTPTQTGLVSQVNATVPSGTWCASNRYFVNSALVPNSNYVTSPSTAGNAVSTDVDLRAQVSMPSWSAPGYFNVIGKWGASKAAYELQIVSGYMRLVYSKDGSATANYSSTVALSNSAYSSQWIRATYQSNVAGSENITFYTSADGVTWTQLGTTQVGSGVGPLFASTAPMIVGSNSSFTGSLPGRVYSAEVRSAVNGTIISSFNPSDVVAPSLTWNSKVTGETWTISRMTGNTAAADLACDLSVVSTTGIPSTGLATLRELDQKVIYSFTPTSVNAGTASSLVVSGFTYTFSSATAGVSVLTTSLGDVGSNKVNTILVSATIDPTFTFTVSSHSGLCGGVAQTGSATATSVSLGHINSTSAVTAAQDLTTATNSGGNTLIYMRYLGAIADGNGHTIADMPGTGNAGSPQSFPSTGTAAFGYSLGWLGGQYVPMTTTNQANLTFAGNTQTDCIVYRAQTAPTTPAGAYSATVIYTAVPTF